MSTIPEAVRQQALHPFRVLAKPKNTELFPLGGATLAITPHPNPQMTFPEELDFDVAAAVDRSRAIAREHGKTMIAWWIAPEHDVLQPALEAMGLVNKESPGYEATENAMALLTEPAGLRPEGVEVRPVKTFEDFAATHKVAGTTFGMPEEPEETVRQRYAEYVEEPSGESYIAVVDGRVAGAAYAAFGDAGLNLFGGAVLDEFRGRGIYRALTFARWDKAVERGTPALTVQAGRMSMPILEKLGFELVAAARVFVDHLDFV